MGKIVIFTCDKCGKEMERKEEETFGEGKFDEDLFANNKKLNSVSYEKDGWFSGDEIYDETERAKKIGQGIKGFFTLIPLLNPTLCKDCLKGYNQIVKNTNKEIEKFLGKKTKGEDNPVKFKID